MGGVRGGVKDRISVFFIFFLLFSCGFLCNSPEISRCLELWAGLRINLRAESEFVPYLTTSSL